MSALYAIGLLFYLGWFVLSYRLAKRVSPECAYSVGSLNLLGLCMVIPGGRVLVLPVIFLLLLVLVYWAARPRAEE
jgi:hypothetical protein